LFESESLSPYKISQIEIKANHNKLILLLNMYKRLSQVKPGKKVIIKSFENDDIFLKLMEMGCVPGELITIEQVAPLKDPISISVAGYHLSLRLDEAENIFVEEI
jgi:ferrous iron transport protein A